MCTEAATDISVFPSRSGGITRLELSQTEKMIAGCVQTVF